MEWKEGNKLPTRRGVPPITRYMATRRDQADTHAMDNPTISEGETINPKSIPTNRQEARVHPSLRYPLALEDSSTGWFVGSLTIG